MTKSHKTPDGDHKITLGSNGVWLVTVAGDDQILYSSTDYERCADAVADVVEDINA